MHWFLDPIQKQYADFNGRATRREFWMFYLWYFFILIASTVVASMMAVTMSDMALLFVGVVVLVNLVLIVPTIALAARRLHDIGMTGWLQLLGFIPYIGGLVLLVLYCLPSKQGANKYGPNKYEPETVATEVAPAVATESTPTPSV